MTNIERKTITTGSRTSNTKKTEEPNGNFSPEEPGMESTGLGSQLR